VRVLTEEGHWEFAAGPVRQVFELLINAEEILRQADLDEALQKYVKFGLMQTVRDRQENLLYERDTGRPFNEKQLAYLRGGTSVAPCDAAGSFNSNIGVGGVIGTNLRASAEPRLNASAGCQRSTRERATADERPAISAAG
jgi:hypothetical protein